MIFLSPKGIAWGGGSEPWGHVPKKVGIFLLFPSLVVMKYIGKIT